MRVIRLLLLLVAVPASAWAGEAPETVRVAAIQCYSRMGEIEYNRRLLAGLIRKAAGAGAKVVVLPECAVTGYMDPGRERVWSALAEQGEGEVDISKAAEPVPGPSTRYFAALAKELHIYLTVPLAEKAGGKYYNTQVLADPSGKLIAHHRKTHLWTPGDGLWVSEGKLPLQVADTPYGRMGLMICFEVHRLPPLLGKADAGIVLYSVGWYGPQTETWYRSIFPRRYVKPYGFAVVVSNWSADKGAPDWPGIGYSCIIGGDGSVLKMDGTLRGSEIVIADLPLPKKKPEQAKPGGR